MNLNKKNIVTVFNTESLNHFFSNSEFRKVCEESRFCICDGIGLKLGSNLIGKEISRYHGPDFMEDTLKGIFKFKKVFVLGGTENDLVVIKEKYDQIEIEGFTGQITDLSNAEYITDIENFDPDIVFVCLGIVKQELLAYELSKMFPSIYFCGAGAAINFLGKSKKRSSFFYRSIGLEWLPRLIREPRMFIRILKSFNGLFGFASKENRKVFSELPFRSCEELKKLL